MEKHPEERTCQDVRDCLLAKKDDGLKATTLNLYNSAIRFFYQNVLHVLWDDITAVSYTHLDVYKRQLIHREQCDICLPVDMTAHELLLFRFL